MAESRVTTAQIITKDTKGILADWLIELRALVSDSRIDIAEIEETAADQAPDPIGFQIDTANRA